MSLIAGDAAGCAVLARALGRVAAGVAAQARALRSCLPIWNGAAGDAERSSALLLSDLLDAQADRLAGAGRALAEFAADLEGAQRQASAADCLPRQTADDLAERARILAVARRSADLAQDRLLTRLRGLGTLGPVVTGVPGPVMGPAVPGTTAQGPGSPLSLPGPVDLIDLVNSLVMAPSALAGEAAKRALAAGLAARSLKDATRTGSAAERALARAEWREALRNYRHLRGSERAFAATAGRLPAPSWLTRVNSPLSEALPVVRSIPVASVLVVGAGTGLDVLAGKSVPMALTKNVAATAAGMAAFSGASTVLVGAGVVGGPVVLGAVAAGFIVSYGVGQAVEHWGDDVADAASAVGDAVGDVASGAKDLAGGAGKAVSGAWNSVFG